MFQFLFFLCIFLVLYTYLVYPLILVFLTRNKKPATEEKTISESGQIPVAVVISVYNEEEHIQGRIENLLNQNYDRDKIKIYIGSDASDDRTDEIIRSINDKRIHFEAFTERRGKISVLNDLVTRVEEPVIVFTDANTEFNDDAIKLLVKRFHDSTVGAVCGELHLVKQGKSYNKDHKYWKYEQFLKQRESDISGLLGANGAIYAIRRELYEQQSSDTIVDDFCIAMSILRQGHRVIYEPEAIAIEPIAGTIQDEFKRRIRIGTGNIQALARFRDMLKPDMGVAAFTFLSHKVIRWFTPHLMILILILSLLLAFSSIVYALLFIAQILIYGYSIYSLYHPESTLKFNLLVYAVFFVLMNIALFIGFLKYLQGGFGGAWERTSRA